jgi:hypothetical protein
LLFDSGAVRERTLRIGLPLSPIRAEGWRAIGLTKRTM